MSELENEVKKNLIKYCYDEINNGTYSMYFNGIHLEDGYDLLFIRVENTPESYPEVYVTDADDMDGHFCSLKNIGASIIIKILNQMVEKKQEKTNPIEKIKALYKLGYDVPANFAVPCIKDYILNKVRNTETCYIGQVGLFDDADGTYLSVFFPDKKTPRFSFNTPLEKLTKKELGCVLRNMKEK